MSGEAVYERYKDALKRGHVASLRGGLEEALAAYAEAASIAPERPTPHASAGTALLRRRRPGEALRHYEVALRMAPRDEAALLGRAQSLAALDRRPEAGDAYDALAEARAADGRVADAVDAARRGLELAEGRERRRMLERLMERLRTAEPDEPGRLALERALRVLDGPAVSAALLEAAAAPPEAAVAEAAAELTAEATAEPDPAAEPPPVAEAELPAPGPAVIRRALDRDLPPGRTAEELATRADAAVDAGEPGPALEALLDLAAAHHRGGRIDASLDACYLALAFDPDNVGLHLALVELYEQRGWSAAATGKLDLLEGLARLDADDEALARIALARAGGGR